MFTIYLYDEKLAKGKVISKLQTSLDDAKFLMQSNEDEFPFLSDIGPSDEPSHFSYNSQSIIGLRYEINLLMNKASTENEFLFLSSIEYLINIAINHGKSVCITVIDPIDIGQWVAGS